MGVGSRLVEEETRRKVLVVQLALAYPTRRLPAASKTRNPVVWTIPRSLLEKAMSMLQKRQTYRQASEVTVGKQVGNPSNFFRTCHTPTSGERVCSFSLALDEVYPVSTYRKQFCHRSTNMRAPQSRTPRPSHILITAEDLLYQTMKIHLHTITIWLTPLLLVNICALTRVCAKSLEKTCFFEKVPRKPPPMRQTGYWEVNSMSNFDNIANCAS